MLEDLVRLNQIMRQDSLEPTLRDPNYLLNQGLHDGNINQNMLSNIVAGDLKLGTQ